MSFWDWMEGWRKHDSHCIKEAIAHRKAYDVKVYRNGTTIMLKYKTKRVIFSGTSWYSDENFEEYIQRHVDIVLGLREDYIL